MFRGHETVTCLDLVIFLAQSLLVKQSSLVDTIIELCVKLSSWTIPDTEFFVLFLVELCLSDKRPQWSSFLKYIQMFSSNLSLFLGVS